MTCLIKLKFNHLEIYRFCKFYQIYFNNNNNFTVIFSDFLVTKLKEDDVLLSNANVKAHFDVKTGFLKASLILYKENKFNLIKKLNDTYMEIILA